MTARLFWFAVTIAAGLAVAAIVGYGRITDAIPSEGLAKAADRAPNQGRNDNDHRDKAKATEDDRAGDSKYADDHGGAVVRLSESQIGLAGIRSEAAKPGRIPLRIELTAEVMLDQDRVAHIVPQLTGIVRSVPARLGQRIKAGEVMAVVDSRQLADARAAYIAAHERTKLAETKFRRAEKLWARKFTAERRFLEAKAVYAEARIEKRSAREKLRALGDTGARIERLLNGRGGSYTRYRVVAPIDGTVIEKHVTHGELIDGDEPLFRIANLDNVWVMASVHEKDIRRIAIGQVAEVRVKAFPETGFAGTVTWISDTIDRATRTLAVRVEVDNRDRRLKPGMFAQLTLAVGATDADLTILPAAIQRQGEETIVFVDEGGGHFERREVKLGARTDATVEVRDGLRSGERVVTSGSFVLRSELEKEGFGGGHGH